MEGLKEQKGILLYKLKEDGSLDKAKFWMGMPREKHHISAGDQTTSQCYCDSCRETPTEAEEVCCNISMCDKVGYILADS